jgi:hypothetical protein
VQNQPTDGRIDKAATDEAFCACGRISQGQIWKRRK